MVSNDNGKILGRMRSLMERIEGNMTYNEAMLNEERLILESTRVGLDNFLEFLTKYKVHKGPFVQLGYIQIYPTDTAYPTDDYYKAMSDTRSGFKDGSRGLAKFDKFMDKVSNTEWNAPTGRKRPNSDIKGMSNKLYPYILKLTNYRIHWQSYDDYSKKSGAARDRINAVKGEMSDDLKAKLFGTPKAKSNTGYYPIGLPAEYDILTFGSKGDNGEYTPLGQEYLTNPEDMESKVPYERTAIRNYLSDIKPQHPAYFGVDENGNIDPMPKELGELLYNTKTNYDSKLAQISNPNEMALAKKYCKLSRESEMADKTFLTQNVAYICGLATKDAGSKESVYWINKNPLFLLSKQKTVNKVKTSFKYLFSGLNNAELQEILNNYARSQADELMAQANPNI